MTTRVLLALLLAAASAEASPSGFPVRPLSVELGVRVTDTTEQLRKSLGVEADHGVLVMEVQPHGPAERAGLRAGDVLTRVAGERVASASDVLDALESGTVVVPDPGRLFARRRRPRAAPLPRAGRAAAARPGRATPPPRAATAGRRPHRALSSFRRGWTRAGGVQ